MTGGQATLSHPLNPSRKSTQPSDSESYTETVRPIPGRKMFTMGGGGSGMLAVGNTPFTNGHFAFRRHHLAPNQHELLG